MSPSYLRHDQVPINRLVLWDKHVPGSDLAEYRLVSAHCDGALRVRLDDRPAEAFVSRGLNEKRSVRVQLSKTFISKSTNYADVRGIRPRTLAFRPRERLSHDDKAKVAV